MSTTTVKEFFDSARQRQHLRRASDSTSTTRDLPPHMESRSRSLPLPPRSRSAPPSSPGTPSRSRNPNGPNRSPTLVFGTTQPLEVIPEVKSSDEASDSTTTRMINREYKDSDPESEIEEGVLSITLAGPRNLMLQVPRKEMRRITVLTEALVTYRDGLLPRDRYLNSESEKALNAFGIEAKLDRFFRVYPMSSGRNYYMDASKYAIIKEGLKDLKRFMTLDSNLKISSIPRFAEEDKLGPSYPAPLDTWNAKAVLYREEVEVWLASVNPDISITREQAIDFFAPRHREELLGAAGPFADLQAAIEHEVGLREVLGSDYNDHVEDRATSRRGQTAEDDSFIRPDETRKEHKSVRIEDADSHISYEDETPAPVKPVSSVKSMYHPSGREGYDESRRASQRQRYGIRESSTPRPNLLGTPNVPRLPLRGRRTTEVVGSPPRRQDLKTPTAPERPTETMVDRMNRLMNHDPSRLHSTASHNQPVELNYGSDEEVGGPPRRPINPTPRGHSGPRSESPLILPENFGPPRDPGGPPDSSDEGSNHSGSARRYPGVPRQGPPRPPNPPPTE